MNQLTPEFTQIRTDTLDQYDKALRAFRDLLEAAHNLSNYEREREPMASAIANADAILKEDGEG